jgi:hypothetical protein
LAFAFAAILPSDAGFRAGTAGRCRLKVPSKLVTDQPQLKSAAASVPRVSLESDVESDICSSLDIFSMIQTTIFSGFSDNSDDHRSNALPPSNSVLPRPKLTESSGAPRQAERVSPTERKLFGTRHLKPATRQLHA